MTSVSPEAARQLRVDVYNPYAEQIRERGMEETLGNTGAYFAPFLQLLGARWVSATDSDLDQASCNIGSVADSNGDILITHDWFVSELLRTEERIADLKACSKPLFIMSDGPQTGYNLPVPYQNIAKNSHILDLNARWLGNNTWIDYRQFVSLGDSYIPLVPMGCSQSWLPSPSHADKVIFLDEPHASILENLHDPANINVAYYNHAIETACILAERGFLIKTFCREKSESWFSQVNNISNTKVIHAGNWVPFTNLLREYAGSSMFFAFFGETFGYSSFENLQLGNGIITYCEQRNAYDFRQMQNSALISLYMTPSMCADIICQFYDIYKSNHLRNRIRDDANRCFSTETFMQRLRTAIKSCTLSSN